ncbi:MAG: hypothetical protein LBG52_00965 [Candidatus Peribacteria bacterium]|jgi:polysaccharide pyruvyl transferase WcaK-like protein|nr:hypothetical protein [Candidatus Peribacteria bacterium]
MLEHSPYIIVNLNKDGERFLSAITQEIQSYLEQGYTIYYVPVAKGTHTGYDDLQCKKLLEQQVLQQVSTPRDANGMQSSKYVIQIVDWESDFHHFVQILKNAELVISTRLHLFLIASFL